VFSSPLLLANPYGEIMPNKQAKLKKQKRKKLNETFNKQGRTRIQYKKYKKKMKAKINV
tara:strand:+ start:84 stop:260 length:177 start_codon:yes stop_codon:yes gene_type:complete